MQKIIIEKKRRIWTRDELIVAFNLYCKIPFSKINYKHKLINELAIAIGRTPSAVAWKLVNFASIDPSLKARNIKGATNISKLDREIFNEFYHNWNSLVELSESKLSKLLNKEIDEDQDILLDYETKNGMMKESIVKVRTNQSFFRKSVLATYENRCCITGLAISELLVASHIIPWALDEKNRLNPSNGLCLNNLHDKAFDQGFITIDNDYKVKLSKHLEDYGNDNINTKFFYDYDNKKIELPKRFIPNQLFLDYHQQNIFKR